MPNRLSSSLFVLPAAIAVAGCGADPVAPPQPAVTPAPAPSPRATEAPRLTVDGEGLRWFLPPGGSARPVAFGAAQDALIAAVERLRGPARRATNQDCGAGPVQFATWDDGLSLLFQDRRFVGWGLDSKAAGRIATAAGIGLGSTRAEVESAYAATISETTLGTEFAAGAVYGLFDGPSRAARVTDMWAGVSCFAR